MKYNADFELAAMVFVIFLTVYVLLQYDLSVRRNREFLKLNMMTLACLVLDIVTAWTISYYKDVPRWGNLLLNELYFAALGLNSYELLNYSIIAADPEGGSGGKPARSVLVGRVLLGFYLAVLAANIPTGMIASFTRQGYVHGPLYFLIWVYPNLFIAYDFLWVLPHSEEMNRKGKRVLLWLYFVLFFVCSYLQLFVFPDVLLSVFSVAVGLMFLLVLLETPDYQRLLRTMEELRTARQKAEQAEEKASSSSFMKSSFLSRISHELRTPLNLILGYSDLLMESTDDPDILENAGSIRSAGLSLLSTADNIKNFLELEEGSAVITERPYHTQSLIRDMLMDLDFYNEDKQLLTRVYVDPDLPTVLRGDSIRILQIMNNLTSNGVRYTEQGEIAVSIRWVEGTLFFSVEDTGKGMREQDISRIRENTAVANDGSMEDLTGIGLGLSVVTRLLSMMGSRLNIESTYGIGSTFSFHLPQTDVSHDRIGEQAAEVLEKRRSADGGAGEAAAGEKDAGYGIRGLRESETVQTRRRGTILAVDDNKMNLDLLQKLLAGSGFVVETALNGREALDRIRRAEAAGRPYRIIFMDHMMPVMDGIEAMRIIREEVLCPKTPVVALTANAVTDAQRDYIDRGFAGYLLKPVIREELLDTIERLTGGKKAEGYRPEEDSAEEEMSGNDLNEVLRDEDAENAGEDRETADAGGGSGSALSGVRSAGEAADHAEGQVQAAAGVPQDDVIARLSRIVDTKTGLMFCGQNAEFYQSVIGDYLEDDRREKLSLALREKDWDAYRIGVHSLKSNSRTIGAAHLSDGAKGLEDACKRNDTAYIEEHHQSVMEEYAKLLADLKMAVEPERPGGSEDADHSGAAASPEDRGMPEEKRCRENTVRNRLLLVDDDDMERNIAAVMLGERYEVRTASSADETKTVLGEWKPDLILMDIHMPQMNGFALMDRLRNERSTAGIPVIFFTGDEDRDLEIRALKKGAADFIRKPFTEEILLQRVGRIIRLGQVQSSLRKAVRREGQEVRNREHRLALLSTQVMRALAGVVDARDHYTSGHSGRVAEYAREIAARAGKTETEQNDVFYAGLLHDIGKISVPDSLLNQTGKLTEEQFAVIRRYPAAGAKILENITAVPELAEAAHWHHERWDGTGYPDGLAGEKIPDAARIIAVADSYDAMASKRSYRDSLSQKAIRREIERGIGTQFDPAYAKIMLQMIDEDRDFTMRERYQSDEHSGGNES